MSAWRSSILNLIRDLGSSKEDFEEVAEKPCAMILSLKALEKCEVSAWWISLIT